MKQSQYFSLMLVFFVFFSPLPETIGISFLNSIKAQNCNGLITDNRLVGNTHYLYTVNMTLIFRGDYTYEMEFFNNEKGISARITSKNGVEFNQGDEMIFVDANNTRKT